MKRLVPLILMALAGGCAALNVGWYKPGVSQQEFAQDKYQCMASSQMNVSQASVNGSATPSYGSINGGAAAYTTTNTPLFSACMQARGYVWTNQAAVQQYEASQSSYEPVTTPATVRPAQSAGSSAAAGDAYYACMKRHHWDDNAEETCQRYSN